MLFLFLLFNLSQILSEPEIISKSQATIFDVSKFKKEEVINLNIENLTAQSVLVKEFNGKVLFQKNANQKKEIASLTKLMSSYVGYIIFPATTTFIFDNDSINQDGSVGNFNVGEKISRDDILKASLVSSSNDAIYLLAKTYGLSKFVDLMNSKAKDFNLQQTFFLDPSGLDKNFSTANDLALLLEKIYSYAPEIFSWTLLEKIIINEKILWTTNILLPKYKSIIVGGKTGFKESSGENLVLILKFKKSPFIGVVILDSKNRWQDAEKIIDQVKKYYGS